MDLFRSSRYCANSSVTGAAPLGCECSESALLRGELLLLSPAGGSFFVCLEQYSFAAPRY